MSMMQQQRQFILNLERAIASLAKSMDDTLEEMKEDSETTFDAFNDFIMQVVKRVPRDELLESWESIESILPQTFNVCSLVDKTELTTAIADLRYAVFDLETEYDDIKELYFDARHIIDEMAKKTITTIRKTINDHIKVNTKIMDRGVSVSEGLKAQLNDMEGDAGSLD